MAASFDPLEFHARAVRTPSHDGVTAMRALLVETLEDLGLDPSVDDAGNVLASRGSGDPHVVLNTHIDTVPPAIPTTVDDAIVRGRGACDAKGPLAAMLDAFVGVEPRTGRVSVAITPDEETDSTGAAALTDRLSADAYIVGEPTGLDVCHAARGRFQATITVHGESAHAAEAASGTNAVDAAAEVLVALRTFDDRHGPGSNETLGAPSLVPTGVRGGEAPNQVPPSCEIVVDRRSVPPETAAGFRASLAEYLATVVSADVSVSVELADRRTPFLEAFETSTDDPLVKRLVEAAGGPVRPFGAATEASYFAADAPTVVFGPGVLADEEGPVAHSDREYVVRQDITAAAAALRETLDTYVG